DGSMIHFETPEPSERVYYRLEQEAEFEEIRRYVWLPLGAAPTKILVKYMDLDGVMHGPFEFYHEPQAALVENAMDILGSQGEWVHLRNSNGQKLIYWTSLLTYRCGLTVVEWGVNTMTPTMTYDPGDCDVNDPFRLPDDNSRLFSFLPENTDFVS